MVYRIQREIMIHTNHRRLTYLPVVVILSLLACASCSSAPPEHTLPSQGQDPAIDNELSAPKPNRAHPSNAETSFSATIDRSRILPILKTRKWLSEIQASATQGRNIMPLAHDYNDELVVLYALDDPDHLSYMSTEDYERTGMTRRELKAVATENLKSLLPRPVIRTNPFFSILIAGKKYESSLLLLDDLWKGLAPAKDELIVAIPNRNMLLFTDSGNPKGIVALRKQAAQLKKQSSPGLTDMLFIYRNGQFTRYD